MKVLTCLSAAVLLCSFARAQQMNDQKINYPATKKVDTVNTYFGTTVPDPYRWLEDDRAADTKAWVKAENKVTQDYLSQIPYRDAIHKRLQQLWNYEKYSAPFKEGKYTYFYKNDGLQSQSVLWRQAGDGCGRCLQTERDARDSSDNNSDQNSADHATCGEGEHQYERAGSDQDFWIGQRAFLDDCRGARDNQPGIRETDEREEEADAGRYGEFQAFRDRVD